MVWLCSTYILIYFFCIDILISFINTTISGYTCIISMGRRGKVNMRGRGKHEGRETRYGKGDRTQRMVCWHESCI